MSKLYVLLRPGLTPTNLCRLAAGRPVTAAAGRKTASSEEHSGQGAAAGMSAAASPADGSRLRRAQAQARSRDQSALATLSPPAKAQPLGMAQSGRTGMVRPMVAAKSNGSRPTAAASSRGAPLAEHHGQPEGQLHRASAGSQDGALGQHFARPSRIARPAGGHSSSGITSQKPAANGGAGAASVSRSSPGAGTRGVRAVAAGVSRSELPSTAAEAGKVSQPVHNQAKQSEARASRV